MSDQPVPFLNRLALLFSALGSPFVVITLFSLWVIAAYSLNWSSFFLWGGTAFLFVVLLPFLYIVVGVKRGTFTDIHVMLREQRTEPFLVALASVTLLILVYWFEKVPSQLLILGLALWASGFFFLLVTNYWKVSMHAAALTGAIVIASFLVTSKALWFFLFLPLVIWARLYRGRHNIAQSLVAAVLVAAIIVAIFKLARIA